MSADQEDVYALKHGLWRIMYDHEMKVHGNVTLRTSERLLCDWHTLYTDANTKVWHDNGPSILIGVTDHYTTQCISGPLYYLEITQAGKVLYSDGMDENNVPLYDPETEEGWSES